MKLYGAVDLGGTTLKTALIDEKGRILKSHFVDVAPIAFDPRKLTKVLAAEMSRFFPDKPEFFAAALPFVVGKEQELSLASNITEDLSLQELKRCLGEDYGMEIPLFFLNDVRAAAMGELWQGALRDYQESSVYLNMGTGLSMASIVNRRVLTGGNGFAGEIAFCVSEWQELLDSPPRSFLLEKQVSGKALSKILASMENPSLEKVFSSLPPQDSSEKEAVLRVRAKEIFSRLAMHLINICCILDPSAIVIGGGVSREFPDFAPFLEQYMKKQLPFPPVLKQSQLGRFAGLLGAVYWGIEESQGT